MKRKPFLYYLGNSLMGLAVVFLAYIYLPLVKVYFFPERIDSTISKKGIFIQIPKISAQAPIISQVDTVHEEIYTKALKHGVAHARGSFLPGQNGTIYLFAHSSDLPWNITRYNTAFFRIHELQSGDMIKIFVNGREFRYRVFDKKEVWPNEVKYIQDLRKTQMILQTCTPIGTDFKRLLVFAKPLN